MSPITHQRLDSNPGSAERSEDLRFALGAVEYLKQKQLDDQEVVTALVEQLELDPEVARALVLTHRLTRAAADTLAGGA